MAGVGRLRPEDPRDIAGYVLQGRLGAGGMGTVYLSATRGGQPVALKAVHRHLAEDPRFRRRFEQEVRAARRVRGRYVVPVVDSNTEGSLPWLATEYVPGPSLAQAVTDRGPLPPATALRLMAGVAAALESVHAADVVHRDLKPGNVLLAPDGPAVIDFGIARAAEATALTGTDTRIGTPAYMAPEQIRGDAPAVPATDVFALGLTAHFAATGTHPFGGGPAPVILYRIESKEPDLAACPDPLRDIVRRCLAKDPDDRPTPDEVVTLCRDVALGPGVAEVLPAAGWLPADATATTPLAPASSQPTRTATVVPHSAGIPGSPSPPPPAWPSPPIPTPPTPPSPPTPGARRWRRGAGAGVAGVATAAVIALLAWFLTLGGDGNDDPSGTAGKDSTGGTAGSPSQQDPAAEETPSVTGETVFSNLDNGLCLDSPKSGTVNGGECDGGDSQRWEVFDDGRLRNVATGRCILDAGYVAAIRECDEGGHGTRWEMDAQIGALRNVDTEWCLVATPSGDLTMLGCSSADATQWVARAPHNALSNGHTGRCLDGRDGVSTAECDQESGFQQWRMVGDGKLRNVAYDQCLSSDTDGEVFLEECEKKPGGSGESQGWFWHGEDRNGPMGTDDSDGCLDGESRGEVYLYSCDGGDHQQWESLGDAALP
ncbi:serine/threonine-protein kinase [Streptomyces sp. 6N223]|uniref:serine/threonine-protein kinase n=1 Tax=Streptomyces sp. 6N223 TaxID=3457412 RepID=UPI003FD04A35